MEHNVTLPAAMPVSNQSVAPQIPDADFERRWNGWKARGLAHERVVRQRFIVVAIIAGVIALAAVIAYTLLSS